MPDEPARIESRYNDRTAAGEARKRNGVTTSLSPAAVDYERRCTSRCGIGISIPLPRKVSSSKRLMSLVAAM